MQAQPGSKDGWAPTNPSPGNRVPGAVPPPVQIALRPIGNPLPLGFIALAGATLLLSGLQLGWLAPSLGPDVALIIIAFVVPLQLLTSILGYLARDVVVGTGMGLLTGTWLSIALVTRAAPEPGATNDALGLFLLLAGTAMLIPATAALRGRLVPAAVLLTTSARFLVTGVFQLTAAADWGRAAGIVGLVLCALALYAALALEWEDVGRRTVLPLGRRGDGARALRGTFEEQRSGIEHEAGVRRQL